MTQTWTAKGETEAAAAWPPEPIIELRGDALTLYRSQEPEAILSGPAETGKTFGTLYKLDTFLRTYPGAQGVIVRKIRASMDGSVLMTYKRVMGLRGGVTVFGGERPDWFDYDNGSRLWIAGIDNPGKALSSERDIVYVNQTEELELNDWEILTTRTTGRGAVAPWTQLYGDCNPGPSSHWIRHREGLQFLVSRHEDNPTLFDVNGNITEQGVKTLSILDRLTGARKDRLRYGKWVSVEGAVYDEFERHIHIKANPGPFKYYLAGMDEGYTNPAVILVIGFDNDDRAHVVEEFYQRRVLQGDVVAEAKRIHGKYRIQAFHVDPSAAGLIAEMRSVGLWVVEANNSVMPGIQSVKARLAIQGDGRTRLTVDPSCANLINEFESYVWKAGRAGIKDEPEKVNDHALDALRYPLMSGYRGSLFW